MGSPIPRDDDPPIDRPHRTGQSQCSCHQYLFPFNRALACIIAIVSLSITLQIYDLRLHMIPDIIRLLNS